MVKTEQDSDVKKLEDFGKEINNLTKRPLLVMYYCDVEGEITDYDVQIVFNELMKSFGFNKIRELDVLIHTRGGNPNASYLLIQTIRKFAEKIYFLVPQHSYSGGTLMSLGSDKVFRGPYASLGPIDLQLNGKPLLSIEKYVEFVKHASESLSPCNYSSCSSHHNHVGEALLLQLTKEFNPTEIGQFFQLRKLSEYYAKILLNDYMFRYDEFRKKKVERIVKRLNSEYPDHGFDIDFNIAKGLGLNVELMEPNLFISTNMFINLCDILKFKGKICHFLPRDKLEEKSFDLRVPFFQIFQNEVEENGAKK